MKANGLLKCLSAMSLKSFVFITILAGLLASVPCPAAVGQGRDEVALLTTRAAYQQLAPEIEQYKRDVEAHFPVQLGVVPGDWSKPGEVRATVKDLYEAKKISGVVLVGAMPMHRFFMHEHANPNPLFYEDFNLEFIDRNKDGFDDAYVGKPAPKVWVANIRSTEKSADDGVEGLRRFFAKAHNLREGKLHYERRAIVVTDAESAETLVESKLGRHLFGAGGVDVLGAGANTLEGVRKAFAKRAYAICMMGVHSDWDGHALEGGDLCATEIAAMKTGALFTISHGCFTGNWAVSEKEKAGPCTGLSWVFGNGIGLAAVANVRSGGIYGVEKLCQGISSGDYLGQAYLKAKKAAEEEMSVGDKTPGDIVSGVLFIGNPFLCFTP